MLDRSGVALRRRQHRDRAALDQEHHQGAAKEHDRHREEEGRQRRRLRQQDGGHGRNDRTDRQVEQLARLPANQQDDQEHATDDGHGEQRLEQGVGDELNHDDVPVGGGHERAALKGGLERSHARGSSENTAKWKWRFMQVPFFVRRSALRVLLGGALAAGLVGAVGLLGERAWLGATPQDARTRIEADVTQQFGVLSAQLETAVNRVAADPDLLRSSRRATTPAPARCSSASPTRRRPPGSRPSRSPCTAPPPARSHGPGVRNPFPSPGSPVPNRCFSRRARRAFVSCGSSPSATRPRPIDAWPRSLPRRRCRRPGLRLPAQKAFCWQPRLSRCHSGPGSKAPPRTRLSSADPRANRLRRWMCRQAISRRRMPGGARARWRSKP